MEGLVEKNMQSTPQQAKEEQSSPTGKPGLSEEPIDQENPKEDEDIERVYLAGVQSLYDDASHEQVINQLKTGADNPPQAIAALTFDLVSTLDDKSGNTIPEAAIIPAAIQLLEEVGTLAEKSGVIPVDENTLPQALQALVAIGVERGVIDPEEIQGLIQEFPEEEIQGMVAQQEQIAGTGQDQGGVV